MRRSRGKTLRKTERFALCLDNSEYPVSLQQWKIYRVLPDTEAARHSQLRVIDESGEDYLFEAACFEILELPAKVRRLYRTDLARRR